MRTPSAFFERLQRGPLLGDGGMGTQLHARGISYERCFEHLNLTDPEIIKSIHLDYVTAGAEIIETNTFGANRYRLAEHGLEHQVRQLNRAGAKIAREARELSDQTIFVAGCIGPLGRPLAPLGEIQSAQAREAFLEQIEALLQAGVDLLVIETMMDLAEMRAALAAARSLTDLPVVATMSFADDGLVASGEDPLTAARILHDLGADIVGVNCASGPSSTLSTMEVMCSYASDQLSFAAQPNAGLPQRIGGRFLYLSTPDYFSTMTRRLLEVGVRLVGGCCGTTPQHIAAMRNAMTEFSSTLQTQPKPAEAPLRIERLYEREVTEQIATGQEVVVQPYPTQFARLLAEGRFPISVEMLPPRSVKFTRFVENATYLRDLGVDIVNVLDNAMARVRMNTVAAARIIQEQAGLETIVHFTPRDRNLMAVQSDLIGAHATDVRNILAITGDPPSHGDFPNATGIWDVDSIGLLAILENLNHGLDGMGRRLAAASAFFMGCGANPTASDVDLDLERLQRKIEAGAQFIMTQPVYEAAVFVEYLERYQQRYGPLPIPLLIGLQPLHSYQQAEKFHHEVPGIVIPETVRERLRQAGEASSIVGIELIKELFDSLYPLVQGAYIMPLDRYTVVGELLPYLRLRTRTKEAESQPPGMPDRAG